MTVTLKSPACKVSTLSACIFAKKAPRKKHTYQRLPKKMNLQPQIAWPFFQAGKKKRGIKKKQKLHQNRHHWGNQKTKLKASSRGHPFSPLQPNSLDPPNQKKSTKQKKRLEDNVTVFFPSPPTPKKMGAP